jgi:hypothetical protein
VKTVQLILIGAVLLAVIGTFYYFSGDRERIVGKIPVRNLKEIHVTIYQDQKFDNSTTVYYDIRKGQESLISDKHFLFGTMDYEHESDYYANSYDSIIYLSYPQPNIVVALHDLKSNRGYPRGEANDSVDAPLRRGRTLLNKLKQYNPQLIGAGSLQDKP